MAVQTTTSEALRRAFAETCRRSVAENCHVEVTTAHGRPVYLIAPYDSRRRADKTAIRVSADEVRRRWSDFRGIVRLLDRRFVIEVDGEPLVSFSRHPDFKLGRAAKWIGEADGRGEVRLAQAARKLRDVLKLLEGEQ
jgi:hypothetical protein